MISLSRWTGDRYQIPGMFVSAVTLCSGQVIWEVGWARPSISVGVHKLAVVLSLTKRVSYTVKRLCRQKYEAVSEVRGNPNGPSKGSQLIRITSPLRPLPMKILYRRELHKTTPTNFLYHVRLTYWLPLQLLWAELYLKEKGIQIGSPPEKQLKMLMLL